ncbi:fatty acid hydroxylase family protein, partial [Cooperia oncophora]
MSHTFLIDDRQVAKILSDLNPYNLRYLIYMVTPNETIYTNVDDIPNFFIDPRLEMVNADLLALAYCRVKPDGMFERTTENLVMNPKSCYTGVLFIEPNFFYHVMPAPIIIGGRFISMTLYPILYDKLHLIDLPNDSAFVWILCFFVQDFTFYLGHRAIHEAGIFWSFHQMHHSSEYYNLGVALRMSAVQDFGMMFVDLPQALLLPPNMFIVHRYLIVIYQFWLHSN